MEKRIKERYHDGILREAMQRYGVADGQIHLLDGFESFMYEFERAGAAYILRIGHSIRRSEALIQGEVDWLNHLADGGASVARAVLSQNGSLVEPIGDGCGGRFLATAFVKAAGRPPWETGWSAALYERYGQLLGRMHALSRRYELPDPAWKRPEWDDPINMDMEQWLPDSEAVAREKFTQVKAYLRALPKDPASYGLIHQDAHGANFFVDEAGNITLFDFDDCVYSWFIYDIAMVLFYMVTFEDDPPAFTRWFMPHFLRGYAGENKLDPVWLKELPHFMKLREIDLYAVLHRSFDDPENVDDAWIKRYMTGRKHKIESDTPYIDFDFMSLASYLN
ncbi:MAG: phosphotransferase [Anaerolineae bacterium]|nr:phosphotransferase [Anaerolineae bacterium]